MRVYTTAEELALELAEGNDKKSESCNFDSEFDIESTALAALAEFSTVGKRKLTSSDPAGLSTGSYKRQKASSETTSSSDFYSPPLFVDLCCKKDKPILAYNVSQLPKYAIEQMEIQCERKRKQLQKQTNSSSQQYPGGQSLESKAEVGSVSSFEDNEENLTEPESPIKNPSYTEKDDNKKELGLPIVCGPALEVISLGRIKHSKSYCNESYIYPVGFKSLRHYYCTYTPSKKVRYTSEIVEGRESPIFRITHERGKPVFESTAISGVWNSLLKALNIKRSEIGMPKGASGCSGPIMFGIANTRVLARIKALPGADQLFRANRTKQSNENQRSPRSQNVSYKAQQTRTRNPEPGYFAIGKPAKLKAKSHHNYQQKRGNASNTSLVKRKTNVGRQSTKTAMKSQTAVKMSSKVDKQFKLPIEIGAFTLLDLGKIEVGNSAYRTDRHILPVGYKALRKFYCAFNPEVKADYLCEILRGKDGPFYRVSHERGDPTFESVSMTGVWMTLLSYLNVRRRKLGLPEGSNYISGPMYFGLTYPKVTEAIKSLPGANKISFNYKRRRDWQDPNKGKTTGEMRVSSSKKQSPTVLLNRKSIKQERVHHKNNRSTSRSSNIEEVSSVQTTRAERASRRSHLKRD